MREFTALVAPKGPATAATDLTLGKVVFASDFLRKGKPNKAVFWDSKWIVAATWYD